MEFEWFCILVCWCLVIVEWEILVGVDVEWFGVNVMLLLRKVFD